MVKDSTVVNELEVAVVGRGEHVSMPGEIDIECWDQGVSSWLSCSYSRARDGMRAVSLFTFGPGEEHELLVPIQRPLQDLWLTPCQSSSNHHRLLEIPLS